jgi:phenylacetic acid degradation operon negative regulatory protein
VGGATGADRTVPWEGPGRGVTARSVVASILLPLEVPELAGRSLVRCCQLFGIAEGTARVAISRMVAAGELEVTGPGRYRLSGRMLARHARQRAARHPTLLPWSGAWLVVVGGGRGSRLVHRTLGTALVEHRLFEVRPALWARPANLGGLEEVVGRVLRDQAEAGRECLVWHGRLLEAGQDDRTLVAQLVDLEAWAAEARALVVALQATLPDLEGGRLRALAACFEVAAAAVRHLTTDPLLPEALLPEDWPGPALRATYDAYEDAYRRLLVTYLRTVPAEGPPEGAGPGRSTGHGRSGP